jgi:hypothetical protein
VTIDPVPLQQSSERWFDDVVGVGRSGRGWSHSRFWARTVLDLRLSAPSGFGIASRSANGAGPAHRGRAGRRREIERVDALKGLMAQGMTLAGAMRIIALQTEIAELNRRLATRRSD